MKWFVNLGLTAALVCGLEASTRADDTDPKAIVDKGIKALGGEEKLAKAQTVTWKAKGKFFFGDNENSISSHATVEDLDNYRSEFEGKFGDNEVKGVVVLKGDKGWRKFGDNQTEMDNDALANEKRMVYLSVIPSRLLPLKTDAFKLEAAAEEKVGDKPAVGIKVTPKDGKDFKLYFDKERGLPVKLVATVVGFDGQEFSMETTYSDYKEFDGIKKATKIDEHPRRREVRRAGDHRVQDARQGARGDV